MLTIHIVKQIFQYFCQSQIVRCRVTFNLALITVPWPEILNYTRRFWKSFFFFGFEFAVSSIKLQAEKRRLARFNKWSLLLLSLTHSVLQPLELWSGRNCIIWSQHCNYLWQIPVHQLCRVTYVAIYLLHTETLVRTSQKADVGLYFFIYLFFCNALFWTIAWHYLN